MMPPGFGLLENGNGRPQMMMTTGGVGMFSPIRSAPMDGWDMKAMAAHRHRILVAENTAQRVEIEKHVQAIPAQTCPHGFRPPLLHSEPPPPNVFPPGFRPAPLHSELPPPNVFPPGFRPPSTYSEAMHPQSCPPGFRPPVESAIIMQPETKFRSLDPVMHRPEFRLDDRPGDPAGMHDTMRGPSMHGTGDKHGWYPNESSSGAGRVLESRFVDPQLSRPYETEDEHVRNLYRGAELENENWRLPNSQLLSLVPVPNVTQPLAYNPEAFWPGNLRIDSLAGIEEAGKRRSFEDSSPRTPPFKRPRTGHEVESNAPAWARSRLESERAWSNGLRMSDDKSRDHHNQKQTERRNKFESSNGTLDRWHDEEESRTRRSPSHYQRGSLSPDRNQAPTRLEVFQESEFRSRPSLFREISQSDTSSFRAFPRPVHSNSKEKQYRKSSNPGSCSSGLSQNSRSPTRLSKYDRRSLGLGERDSWPPRLPARKTSSGAVIDHWRSAEVSGKSQRNMEENGSLTSFHSSRVFEECSEDDRGRIDSQLLSAVTKEKLEERGTGGSVAQETYNSLENVAPASTNEKPLSLPVEGTVQKLPETKPKAERCGNLERMPLYKNGSQFSTEKAGSRSSKRGENQSASAKPISATSLKITRYFTNNRSAPKNHASRHSEVDRKTSVEKVTPWKRRTVFVSAGPLLSKISGFDEEAAEAQDEAEEGEILQIENRSKASRLHLERSSISSEAETAEGGLIKPSVALPRVSPEVIVHPSSLMHGTEGKVTKMGSRGNERAGQKWISTGFRSKHIPSAKLPKAASGSDSQSPDSLGKSYTPGGCVLTEDATCSEQMEEGSPTSTVRNSRVSVVAGVNRLPDNPSVPTSGLVSLVKEQVICAAGELRSDVGSLSNSVVVSETQNPKPSFVAEKSSLQESTVQRQNSGQFRSSCNSRVGDVKVKPFVGVSGSPLDDWLSKITSSIPLAMDTNEGFKSNGSNSERLQGPVKSELRHSLTSNGEKLAEQPSAALREKTTSLKVLAKVVDKRKAAAVVQGKQHTKVLSQPSDVQNASSTGGDKLARQRDRGATRQGNFTSKVASFWAGAGSPPDTGMAKGMSVVSQRPGLQELRNPGGNTQAGQKGKVTMRGTGLSTNLNQVMPGEGEVTLSDSEDDFEVITEPSKGVTRFDRELGKKRKIMHPEKGGNFNQVLFAANSLAKIKKIGVPEQSSGPQKFKADATLMKKHVPILKGGIQRTSPVMKTKDILPLSSHLPVQTPPLRTVGRSFVSNKTWHREATPVNTQQLPNTPQKPAVVAQPSTYIRKKFSMVRNPAPQVPQSNVVVQPNVFSRFPRVSVTPSRNKTYFLSASKSKQLVSSTVANAAVTASASPGVKTLNTRMSELGAMPSEKPSPSPVKRLQPVGNEASVTHSELIVAEPLSISQVSPSKPSHREGSSGRTTLASSPFSKSPGGATTEGYVVSGTRLYRKRKFDQVRVGSSTTSASPNLKPGLEKCDVPQGYIKRKTNQLVRCDHPGASAKDALQNVVESGDQVKLMNKQRRYSSQLKTKTKLGRVLSQKKGSLLGLARVWTLNNEGKQTTTALGTSRDWRYPLFPWKRSAVVAPRLRRGRPLHEGKMGALFFHISNQLQKYRSAHPVYTTSADGFSLHRSGVVSKSGANLKWTKSLKTQSILASEAATKVVAEAEKKKRDKKEAVVMAVAKARDERRAKLPSGSVNPSSISSLKPLGIGGSVYVRKGFGNQLVRNLKTVARAVASEKFRWSLRNARLRRAKKQSYCVYYTRFGVCKRGDGKCLYIHDPEKVAVCTKFLRGSCSDSACRLTHKVIPERMSDCSYFLEGLCTNESCPYRHVNVSKEAPICEAFLQGYCADGDKCTKKHTYVCPEYALTGSCSSSTCKLRHPKKATKESADPEKEAPKRELQKGRYFTLTAPAEADHQEQPVATANKVAVSGDEPVDFISIDEYDSESSKEYQKTGSL